MPEELHEQVPLMKEVLTAMGIPIFTREGYEADDILGTVAKKAQAAGMEVTVVSGDRDLLQLSDAHIKISIPKTSRGTTEVHTYYPEDVKREYQVTPEQFIDVKALMGDTSDNIPGVPSIGEKTATNLILQFGSVNGVYEHLSEVKPPRAKKSLEEHRDLAELSYKLAKICIEAPVEFSPEDARIGDLYTKEAYEYMSRLEFKSLLAKFGDHVKKEAAAAGFPCCDGSGRGRGTVSEGHGIRTDRGRPAGRGNGDLRSRPVPGWPERLSDPEGGLPYGRVPGWKNDRAVPDRTCMDPGAEKPASIPGSGLWGHGV